MIGITKHRELTGRDGIKRKKRKKGDVQKQRKREITRNYKNKQRREVKEKGCRQKQ